MIISTFNIYKCWNDLTSWMNNTNELSSNQNTHTKLIAELAD